MKPIEFCDRCRGMEVGWNRKYLKHRLGCFGRLSKLLKIFTYTVAAALIISFFPTTTVSVFSNPSDAAPAVAIEAVSAGPLIPISDPAIDSVEELLRRHSRVSPVQRSRIARAVVDSARRNDVDPYLISSILLVESSANPFAISNRDAVGIMQIHVPTWGSLADLEQINLFRVEDNVELGTRILKDYTQRYGLWDGVGRYLGASSGSEAAVAYVSKVQTIYSDRQAD